MDYFGFKPYVSAAARRRQAERAVARLGKKGKNLSPVAIEGRAIARTFWGKAWCDNLERYSDFANRLPRGRTYVRNGSVVDLQIAPGAVNALVSGSDLYRIHVEVASVPKTRWRAVCADCSGEIDSLIELLQGRLSQRVMARICQEKTGLFPSPAEIKFSCSCPDWASMCKHVAAVLYGIGARLDAEPELLFLLRKVDQKALIAEGGQSLARSRKKPSTAKVLETEDLSELFGIEISSFDPSRASGSSRATSRDDSRPLARGKAAAGAKPSARAMLVKPRASPNSAVRAKPAVHEQPAVLPKPSARKAALTAAKRASVAQRMKEYWSARRRRSGKE